MLFLKSKPLSDWLLIAIAWLSIGIVSVFHAGNQVLQGDTLFEARDGLDQLAKGLTTTDSWSWVTYGKEWIPNSWLWNLTLGWLYNTGGETLAFVITRLILCFVLMSLIWLILGYTKLNSWLRVVVLGFIEFATIPWISARPQIMDYVIAVFFLWFVLRITYKKKLSSNQKIILITVVGVLLLVLWQNMHLTAILGVFFFVFVVIALVRTPILSKVPLIIFGIGSLFATPYGWVGVSKLFNTTEQSLNVISEWSSIMDYRNVNNGWLYFGVAAMLLLVILCFYYHSWWGTIILIVCGVGSTFIAIRFIPYTIIIGLVCLLFLKTSSQQNLDVTLSDLQDDEKIEKDRQTRALLSTLGATVLCFIAVISLVLAIAGLVNKEQTNRVAGFQVTELSSIPKNQRVFTDSLTGDAIEFYRPDLSPVIDSRSDLFGSDYTTFVKRLSVGGFDKNKFLSCIDNDAINVVVVDKSQPSVVASYLSNWKMTNTTHYLIYQRPDFLLVPALKMGTGSLECEEM